MLSSTFMQEGRLKIELPQASLAPTGKQKTDPLVVTVTQSWHLPRQRSRADQFLARHAARRHPGSGGRRPQQAGHGACRCALHAPVGGDRHGCARQAGFRAHQHRDGRRSQTAEMNAPAPARWRRTPSSVYRRLLSLRAAAPRHVPASACSAWRCSPPPTPRWPGSSRNSSTARSSRRDPHVLWLVPHRCAGAVPAARHRRLHVGVFSRVMSGARSSRASALTCSATT